jgi:hypothetical protein
MAHGGHVHAHDHDHSEDQVDTGVEAFGVRFVIEAPVSVTARLDAALPPGWRRCDPGEDAVRLVLRRRLNQTYRVEGGGESLAASSDARIALEILGRRVREYVALHAPDLVFVHAGVVGHAGRAIVIPGLSFSGKTTLVAELVRAGATYFSDEFAVLDSDGRVHPYPKPLSLRAQGPGQVDHDVRALGGTVATEPLPVGLILVTQYGPDATWEPQELTSGEAVLRLMANTIPAQDRPQQSLEAISKAVADAVALEGVRGDAAELVDGLLALAAQ